MSSEQSDSVWNRVYQNRVGTPDTGDEVRGYWIFLFGVLLATIGVIAFLMSTSAVGADGFTLREGSIILMAVGLTMLLSGPVIRLPLAEWANYAAFIGQAISFAAVIWLTLVFPTEWSTLTGNQPVILVYTLGLAIIVFGGIIAPLIAGATRTELDATRGRSVALEDERNSLRVERDRFERELEQVREESDTAGEGLRNQVGNLENQLESLRASQAQFELYEDRNRAWRWRLRHRNGNVIADSGEGYSRKHNAKKGMASVRRNALGADLLEIQRDPDEDPAAALDATPVLATAIEDSNAEFDVYEDEAGQYRWRLIHENGNILADSGEGYSSKQKATQGVESVKTNAGPASYLEFDPASFEIYRDNAGKWRWRFVHKNGNIIAAASEGYTRRRDAKRSVESIRENIAEAGDERFDVYEDARGEYRWRYQSRNNEIVATSGEGYDAASEATSAVERFQQYAPAADALDVGFAAFEVYKDTADEWRWRLRHRNGNILADSGEGYASRTGAHEAIESVKRNSGGAEIT